MKALFDAIRKCDIAKMTELINAKPELVNCVAKQPPKKDDGQSPLQVAFKTANFRAVKLLLEHGADVNFIDSGSVNEWKTPVLHDAIKATIAFARFEYPADPWNPEKKDVYEVKGVKENFDKVFLFLQMMIEKGADVNSVDSYGNTALMRFCLDVQNFWSNRNRPLAKETIEDVKQVWNLLLAAGADINKATSTRQPVTEMYAKLIEQLK